MDRMRTCILMIYLKISMLQQQQQQRVWVSSTEQLIIQITLTNSSYLDPVTMQQLSDTIITWVLALITRSILMILKALQESVQSHLRNIAPSRRIKQEDHLSLHLSRMLKKVRNHLKWRRRIEWKNWDMGFILYL